MDLRIPSGAFFALLGAILVVSGLAGGASHAPLTTVNVNLYSGAAMLAFGAAMLLLAARRP